MSIRTDNRSIALQSLKSFQAFEREYIQQGQTDAEKVKHLLNAVQQASLKLGSQGLRRCMLYISGQMSKECKENNGDFNLAKAYTWLYCQMAQFSGKHEDSFQYYVLNGGDESEPLTILETRLGFFFLCLKRIAAATYDEKREVIDNQ